MHLESLSGCLSKNTYIYIYIYISIYNHFVIYIYRDSPAGACLPAGCVSAFRAMTAPTAPSALRAS